MNFKKSLSTIIASIIFICPIGVTAHKGGDIIDGGLRPDLLSNSLLHDADYLEIIVRCLKVGDLFPIEFGCILGDAEQLRDIIKKRLLRYFDLKCFDEQTIDTANLVEKGNLASYHQIYYNDIVRALYDIECAPMSVRYYKPEKYERIYQDGNHAVAFAGYANRGDCTSIIIYPDIETLKIYGDYYEVCESFRKGIKDDYSGYYWGDDCFTNKSIEINNISWGTPLHPTEDLLNVLSGNGSTYYKLPVFRDSQRFKKYLGISDY